MRWLISPPRCLIERQSGMSANSSPHFPCLTALRFSCSFLSRLTILLRRTTLLQRADAMKQLMNEQFWDSSRSIFANRVKHNDSLSEKIGPTSFYPMQGGTASVAQVRFPAVNCLQFTTNLS